MTSERTDDWAKRDRLHITEAGRPERACALSNTTTIGRDNENDIVIDSITVSRCHAVLLHAAAGVPVGTEPENGAQPHVKHLQQASSRRSCPGDHARATPA